MSRKAYALWLMGLAGLALGLRLWGLTFGAGVPVPRPDEEVFSLEALHMLEAPNWTMLNHGWPDGFFLVHRAANALYTWALARIHGGPVNAGCLWTLHPSMLVVPVRALSAVLGAATLWPTAWLARKLAPPAQGGLASLVAAGLLAVNYLHGRDSHFAVSDAALVFFCCCSVAAMVALAEGARWRAALLAGALAGLATALKWHGLFLLPVLAVALLLRPPREEGPLRRLVPAALALAAFAGALALAAPSLAREPTAILNSLMQHRERYLEPILYQAEEGARDLPVGLVFHFKVTLPVAFGWLGLLLGALGMVLVLQRPTIAAVVITSAFASLFLAAVGPSRQLFPRYALPGVPLLCATAGVALVAICEIARGKLRPGWPAWRLVAPLALVAALPAAARLVQVDRVLARPDTRELARQWLLAQPGATVATLGFYTAVHDALAADVAYCNARLPPGLRGPAPLIAPGSPIAAANAMLPTSPFRLAERAIARREAMQPPAGAQPRFVAQGEALIRCGRKVHGDRHGASSLPPCYHEAARFSPGQPTCDAFYDPFDAFLYPYSGFERVDRMGPLVTIYRNDCGPQ